MSVMGWAGHDERKLLDGRVALEMPLKSCSVVQEESRLVANRLMKGKPQKKRADRNTRPRSEPQSTQMMDAGNGTSFIVYCLFKLASVANSLRSFS